MNVNALPQDIILEQFHNKICRSIHLVQEGSNRFRVDTPFMFEDGDNFVILLKHIDNEWHLTDEGHTFMHLSYYMDTKSLQKGTRQKILSDIITSYGLNDLNGELMTPVNPNNCGDALFSFAQAIIKISDITFLNKEFVRSAFIEDFREFISHTVPKDRTAFRYFDKDRDPSGNYVVDCKINGMPSPIFIFALGNDEKTRDATITLHQYERWGYAYRSVGIFQDQENINRKVLARFTDIVDKQFSSLSGNHDRIERHLLGLITT